MLCRGNRRSRSGRARRASNSGQRRRIGSGAAAKQEAPGRPNSAPCFRTRDIDKTPPGSNVAEVEAMEFAFQPPLGLMTPFRVDGRREGDCMRTSKGRGCASRWRPAPRRRCSRGNAYARRRGNSPAGRLGCYDACLRAADLDGHHLVRRARCARRREPDLPAVQGPCTAFSAVRRRARTLLQAVRGGPDRRSRPDACGGAFDPRADRFPAASFDHRRHLRRWAHADCRFPSRPSPEQSGRARRRRYRPRLRRHVPNRGNRSPASLSPSIQGVRLERMTVYP